LSIILSALWDIHGGEFVIYWWQNERGGMPVLRRIRMCIVLVPLLLTLCCANAAAEVLRVAFNYNTAPYHFVSEDYTFVGLHIDMMNWIARERGYEVLYTPFESNGACIKALREGEIDVILGHRMGDGAADGLLYTDELSTSSLCLVASEERRGEIESDDYGRYSAVTEYGLTRSIYMDKMNIKSFMATGSQRMVFEMLLEGRTDVALMVQDCFAYMAHKAGLQDEYTAYLSYISPVSYGMLVGPENAELCNMLNHGLAALRTSGQYQEIYNRWIITDGLDYETIQRINYIIAGSLLVVSLITLIVLGMNRYLKYRVNEKTRELSDANTELDRRMIQLESENRIRYGMIEDSPSAMVSFNADYSVTLMNRAAMEMCGRGDGALGRDVRSLPVLGTIVSKIQQDIFSFEFYGKNVNRPVIMELEEGMQRRAYRYNIYRSRSENSISSALLTVEDVTREEERARELFEQEKNSTLNQLIAGIAHEIRNPLMAIRTSASLLESQWDDPEVREAFARFVPNEVDRINQLIENLIGYARPVKGERMRICLAEIVGECLYLTAIAAKKNNIVCRTELDEDVWIYADRDRIKQALINVIINGIESIEKKIARGTERLPGMHIRVSAQGDTALICVRDEGMGMRAEDIRRCTEPFYTTKSAGTGLGLALVQQFLRKNDGLLSIESVPGEFTEIQLRFRRSESDHGTDTDH